MNDNREISAAKGNGLPDERERRPVKDAAKARGMKVVATARGVKAERRKPVARVTARIAVVSVLPPLQPGGVILHRRAGA